MTRKTASVAFVRAGDYGGLGKIYSDFGGLIPRAGEEVIRSADGWEMDVRSPWRSVLPGLIFMGFTSPISSKLFITTQRIVLVRKIDPSRQLKNELTPLGIPTAVGKGIELRKLQAAGARQFCEIWPEHLRIVKLRRHGKPPHAVDLFLVGDDGVQYAVSFWKPKGSEPEVVSLIESRFPHESS